jgi:hypothetical protein
MNLINMKRWIKASILKEVGSKNLNYLGSAPVEFYVEGDDRKTNKLVEHLEFRLDGPNCQPHGANSCFRFYIEVNILIHATRNEANIYRFDNLQSLASQILNRDWCIYRIGNINRNPEDDSSLVGVMQLMPSEQIKISDFGMIDESVETYEASVEAHYEMYTRG